MIEKLSSLRITQISMPEINERVESIAKIGSWRLDLNSNEFQWSKNAFLLHGLAPSDDFLAQEISQLYEPKSLERLKVAFKQLTIDLKSVSVDVRLIPAKSKNQRLILRIQAQVSTDENGEIQELMGVIQDIDDSIESKKLLLDSERRFKAIFNQSFQFVSLLNGAGELIEANETALNFGGFELETVRGKKFWDTPWFKHKREGQIQLQNAIESAKTGRMIRYETEIIGIGGSTLTIDLSIRPIIDEKGAVMYLIPEGLDISDKREVHQQLIDLNRELEQKVIDRTQELKEINADLESFAYSISHDLRAPLRAITGFSQIIKEDYQSALDEEGLRLLNVIISNSQKMSTLIDDLLLFSRTSRKEVVKAEVDCTKIISTVIQELQTTKGYQHKINLETYPIVQADFGMIKQVFINLVDNACKYSSKAEAPEVTITCRDLDFEFEFCISDNGAGFDSESAKNLFQVFQRLHSSKDFEGTGVGLSIVRKIVEKHGGRVHAEGMPNKGAKFYFTLPKQV